MHLKRRGVHEEARANELVVFAVLTQNVAHILAEKTLDALAKFLYAFDIGLLYTPSAIGRIGRTRPEFPDGLLYFEVPGNVGDQIPDYREGMHGLENDRHLLAKIAEPGHAHEFGHAIDLSGTRAAFACLAIPPHGQVGRLLRLNAVNGIENDHALVDWSDEILELTAGRISAPDSKQGLRCHLFHLLDHGFEFVGQRPKRTLLNNHCAVRTALDHDVAFAPFGIFVWEIFTKLRAPALLAR